MVQEYCISERPRIPYERDWEDTWISERVVQSITMEVVTYGS